MSAIVRAITPPDIAGYHRCLDLVARERRYLAFLQAPSLKRSIKFVRSLLENRSPMMVAIEEGTVVGWCDIYRHPRDGFTHRGMLGLGVHPAHRQRGLGRRLMSETIASAWDLGMERIELEVFANNAPAIQLYLSLGFVLEGTLRQARKLEGVIDDVLIMALLKAE